MLLLVPVDKILFGLRSDLIRKILTFGLLSNTKSFSDSENEAMSSTQNKQKIDDKPMLIFVKNDHFIFTLCGNKHAHHAMPYFLFHFYPFYCVGVSNKKNL